MSKIDSIRTVDSSVAWNEIIGWGALRVVPPVAVEPVDA